MHLSNIVVCVAAIVVCILIIEPNISHANHHKIKIAKKLAGLLLLSGGKKFIIPLPLPLPLPFP